MQPSVVFYGDLHIIILDNIVHSTQQNPMLPLEVFHGNLRIIILDNIVAVQYQNPMQPSIAFLETHIIILCSY